MNPFLIRYNALMQDLERQVNAQAHIAEQQHKLIERLMNENKWQLEQLNIAQEQTKQL